MKDYGIDIWGSDNFIIKNDRLRRKKQYETQKCNGTLIDCCHVDGNDGRMRIFKHEAFFPWVFNFALVLIGFGAKAVVHSVAEIDLIF